MVLTYDSWSINRRDASQAEGCVSAETNTERFRISWHTPHIITFTAECTAFSQWLSLFRNICGRLSCGAASIMLRSKATVLTVNLVCVCCSSSVLKKMPFIASTSVQMLVKTWKYCANSSVFSSQIPSDEWRRSRVSSATTNRSNHVSSRCNICQTLHSRSWAEVAVLSFFFQPRLYRVCVLEIAVPNQQKT